MAAWARARGDGGLRGCFCSCPALRACGMSAAVAAHGQMRARLTDAIPLALLLINTTQCPLISLCLAPGLSIYTHMYAGAHGMDSARPSLVTLLRPLAHAPCRPKDAVWVWSAHSAPHAHSLSRHGNSPPSNTPTPPPDSPGRMP